MARPRVKKVSGMANAWTFEGADKNYRSRAKATRARNKMYGVKGGPKERAREAKEAEKAVPAKPIERPKDIAQDTTDSRVSDSWLAGGVTPTIAPVVDPSGSRKGMTMAEIEEMQRTGSQMYMAERELVIEEVEKVQLYEDIYERIPEEERERLADVRQKQLEQISAEREYVSEMIGGEERAEDITGAIRKAALESAKEKAKTAPPFPWKEGVEEPPPVEPLTPGLDFRVDSGLRKLLFLGIIASIVKSLAPKRR